MISIWYKYRNEYEVIDQASNSGEAAYLVQEYRLAFNCSANANMKVWAGRRDQEPPNTTGKGDNNYGY